MSYTSIDSKESSFFTREKGMLFTIRVNEEISASNIAEVKRRVGRVPYDAWVIRSGIEIRNSLAEEQKQAVLERIAQVTIQDFDYCWDEEIVMLSDHVVSDYLQAAPEVLVKRGWSCDEVELLIQAIRMLVNSMGVEKAMMQFEKSGMSKESLSYTVVGDDLGKIRKASIVFKVEMIPPTERIFVVTVLRSN